MGIARTRAVGYTFVMRLSACVIPLLLTSAALAQPTTAPIPWPAPHGVYPSATAPATVDTAPKPTTQQVDELMTQLGSDDYQKRQAAQAALRKIVKSAETQLRLAAAQQGPHGKDAEIVHRSRQILAAGSVALPTNDDPVLLNQIEAYVRADAGQKRVILQQLLGSSDPQATVVLVQLLLGERANNPATWHRFLQQTGLDSRLNVNVAGIIQCDQVDLARQWLNIISDPNEEVLAPAARGNAKSQQFLAQHQVACFDLIQQQLDEALKWARTAAGDPPTPGQAALMANLLRAQDDLAGAMQQAKLTGDPDIVEEFALLAGDWPSLAGALAKQAEADANVNGPRDYALEAVAWHLAGKTPEADKALTRAQELNQQSAAGTGVWRYNMHIARAMILIDRADAAVDYLSDHGAPEAAFELLCECGQFDRALQLADQWPHPPAPNPSATKPADRITELQNQLRPVRTMLLQIYKARLFCLLGGPAKGAALFDQIAAQLADTDNPSEAVKSGGRAGLSVSRFYAILAENEQHAGLIDRAAAHWTAALQNSNGDDSYTLAHMYRGGGGSIMRWRWMSLLTSAGDEPRLKTLQRLWALNNDSLPLKDFKAIFDHPTDPSLIARGEIPAIYVQRLAQAGQWADAEKFVEDWKQYQPNPQSLYGVLAQQELAAGRDQQAIDASDAALKSSLNLSALLCKGIALTHLHRKAEGEHDIALANLAALSEPNYRQPLVQALRRLHLDDQADQQAMLMLHTEMIEHPNVAEELRLLSDKALRRGDNAAALPLLQRLMIDACLGVGNVGDDGVLPLRLHVHQAQAGVLLEQGKLEEAMREIKIAQDLCPIDVDLPAHLVPLLEKAGHRAEADAAFTRASDALTAALKAYPDATNLRNNLAWLQAVCHRQLDQARGNIEQCLKRDPGNPGYWDTLAIIQLHQGDRAAAIKSAEQALALQPEADQRPPTAATRPPNEEMTAVRQRHLKQLKEAPIPTGAWMPQ